jgi:hypothetical protein
MNATYRILAAKLWFLGATALLGCHAPPEPAPQPAPLAATAPSVDAAASSAVPAAEQPGLGPHRSPVTVKLVGPQQVGAGQDIEVVAEVEQFVGASPVELTLLLPEGAHLVSGASFEALPSGDGKLVRRFVVHLDRVPTTDIEVEASTSNAAFGARAKSAYRFGRPEPRFAEPPRTARPVIVSGKNLGKPIQLKP